MKTFLLLLALCLSCSATPFDQFCSALGKVESGENPRALNSKERAIGIYQIRPAYFKDAKEFDKSLSTYSHKDCYDPAVAKMVVHAYLERYARHALSSGDFETLARLHNAGPGWAHKKSATNNYWEKIKKNLTP